MSESKTPSTNHHAEWLRQRAQSMYYATAKSGLLDAAHAIERIESDLAAALAERDAAKAALLCPGQMRCAKCNFELSRRTLFTLSGTVGAGTSETEPCPNGCGPLWPVTWEQEARSCYSSLDRLFDEKQKAEAEHDETKALLVNSAATEKGVMPRGGMDADWWTVAIKERRTRKAAEAERDALAARVEQAEASRWQPIETCPKSCRGEYPNYVLFYNGHHIGVGFCYLSEDGDDGTLYVDETDQIVTPRPTHCMPLPLPPGIDAALAREEKS